MVGRAHAPGAWPRKPANPGLPPFLTALPVGTAVAQAGRARVRLRRRAGILKAREVTGFHPLPPTLTSGEKDQHAQRPRHVPIVPRFATG